MANEIADAGGIGQALADARERARRSSTARLVGALIAADDPGALAALRQLGRWLGAGLPPRSARARPAACSSSAAESPSAGELLLDPIREAYLEHLPARGYHPEPEFVIAELVNDAGVVGAADLARVCARHVEPPARSALG